MAETRHLSELEARASAGDPEAALELGLALMEANALNTDPHRAVELIRESSLRGHAPATERNAVFAAMGMDGPRSWDRALDLLQLAAEQGSDVAAAQLMLLADNRADSDRARHSRNDGWRSVRQRIDLSALLQQGERRFVSDRPRVRVIGGFATPAECRWVIGAARPRLKPATVFDKEKGGLTYDQSRSNSAIEFQPHNIDLVTEMLRCRIAAAIKVPVQLLEPSQILHYAVGQQFTPHYDFLDPANAAYAGELSRYGQRIATFLIYLSDEYEGGETQFPAAGLTYKGPTGDAIFWANLDNQMQPDPLTLHAGLPPASGEKWVFSQWIRERVPED